MLLVNQPDHYFDILGDLPEDVQLADGDVKGPLDFIHLFAENEADLHNNLLPLKEMLAKDGSLWVSWIKGSSKMSTDINGNDVRELGLKTGLVDVKVCAVDKDWSALKFMYRKEDR